MRRCIFSIATSRCMERKTRSCSGIPAGQGIKFDIYDAAAPPVVKEGAVDLYQPLTGMTVEIPCDLVVLSTPLVAPADSAAIANLMRIPVDGNNFFMEAHAKLRPLDFATDGIFLAGTARYPATVREAHGTGTWRRVKGKHDPFQGQACI